MLTVYSAGFIDMKKQYLTVGVNGLTDAAEFMGLDFYVEEGVLIPRGICKSYS